MMRTPFSFLSKLQDIVERVAQHQGPKAVYLVTTTTNKHEGYIVEIGADYLQINEVHDDSWTLVQLSQIVEVQASS